LVLAAVIAVAGIVAAVRGDEGESAADALKDHGLRRLDRVWLLAEEFELRRELAELPQRRERIVLLEKDLEARIERNRTLWQQSQASLAALKQSLRKLPTSDPQRAAIQRQIDALETSAIEPGKLGGQSETRSQVIELTATRHELSASAASIRGTLPQLVDRYASLARDQQVQAALRRAGEGHRLGPQRSYQADLQKLAEYERLAHTRWVPIHLLGGQVRVTGLADDHGPITFSWIDASHQPTLITATAAEAAGLTIPDDAPREAVALDSSRRVMVRRMAVPYLRFGACVLRDVSVLILPPEAEDWGCRIGREALADHVVRVELERLRMWIDD
jgi:hypothetical protein